MKHVLFIFSLLLQGSLIGQVVHFRHVTADHGLPVNGVTAIVQDKTGFIWIGTPEGLCRYDGFEVITFAHDPNDENTISGLAVKCLAADSKNRIWAGTRSSGLNLYDPEKGKFTRFSVDSTRAGSLSNNHITCILEVHGQIFVGTAGGGINIFNEKDRGFSQISQKKGEPQSLSSNYVRSLSYDGKDKLWIGYYDAGVSSYHIPSGKFTHFTQKEGLLTNEVRTVFADSRGNVWVGLWQAGTAIIESATGKVNSHQTRDHFLAKNPYGMISMFMEDRNGSVWMATAEHGICRFDYEKATFTYFEHNPEDHSSISDNTTFALLEDQSGLIWTGTWHGGISILNPRNAAMEHYKKVPGKFEGLHNNTVWAFAETNSGEVYVGTSGGVTLFNPETKKFELLPYKNLNPTFPSEKTIAQALFLDKDNSLWIGSNGAGIYRYFPATKNYEHYNYENKPGALSYHTVSGFARTLNDELFVATLGAGICKFNYATKRFENYFHTPSDPGSISDDNVYYILAEKNGKIWVATNSGLDLFDPFSLKSEHYRYEPGQKNSLPGKTVYHVSHASNGDLLIATSGGGARLLREKGEMIIYDKSYGMPENKLVSSIVEDNKGIIWMTTSNGLFRVDPENKTARCLNVEHGIQGKEFAVRSALKSKSGHLYFGGSNGFNRFLPGKIIKNPYPPKVVLSKVQLMDQEYSGPLNVRFLETLEVDPEILYFSIGFSGLEFSHPEGNTFQYFLEGFHNRWIQLGNNREIKFTGLNHGEYLLKIQAFNSDGVPNPELCRVRLILHPPFYKTTWFYALLVLLSGSVIFGYIRLREQRLKKEKLILESMVTQRTRELREEKEKVELAHKDISDSIHYARRIQRSIIPEEENLQMLFPESFVFYQPKDIVSGDFYWFWKDPNGFIFLAAADCTGHGVPGALMSMLGTSILNQVIREQKYSDPGLILEQLNQNLFIQLSQNNAESGVQDGMDIALLRYSMKSEEIIFAGANRPVLLFRNGKTEAEEFKGSKQSIGGPFEKKFSSQSIMVKPGDRLFVFTDGFADQFGGKKGKKLMTKNLKRLLGSYQETSMKKIGKELKKEFKIWKGNHEQVDDVLVIGLEI
jgi:ligand-binding sensor domain-containing protein/serine phosphatase RsbU (regulator of sigma subunit)